MRLLWRGVTYSKKINGCFVCWIHPWLFYSTSKSNQETFFSLARLIYQVNCFASKVCLNCRTSLKGIATVFLIKLWNRRQRSSCRCEAALHLHCFPQKCVSFFSSLLLQPSPLVLNCRSLKFNFVFIHKLCSLTNPSQEQRALSNSHSIIENLMTVLLLYCLSSNIEGLKML